MKKVKEAIRVVMSLLLLAASGSLPAQAVKNMPGQCNNYPTSSPALNSSISDFISETRRFDTRFASIFNMLTGDQQQQVYSFVQSGNQDLFSFFPQFDDAELRTSVGLIHDRYSVLLKLHADLFPGVDSRQRTETLKSIIGCAGGQATLQEEITGSGKYAIDPCESERKNCIISVASTAAAMHLACGAADLTFFAGIVCHAAAFAYQWAAGNNCNIAARKCRQTSQ